MKFRKKPVVIEATNWDGTYNAMLEIKAMFPEMKTLSTEYHDGRNEVYRWKIETLEGGHYVSKGDWVIKGVKGEFYPCKPDIFVMTYDLVTT